MAKPPDAGPNTAPDHPMVCYPWGTDPWPGTDPTQPPPAGEAKTPDFWYDDARFQAVMASLQSRYDDIQVPRSGKSAQQHLDSAGQIQASHFGSWAAGRQLYQNAQIAHARMNEAYTNFLKAFAAVIERLNQTKKVNTGVEEDTVGMVQMVNKQVDPPPVQ